MSIPLRIIRDRIRARIRDTDSRNPTFQIPELDMAICDTYLLLGSQVQAPSLYTASAFTISAGSETFTLPTTVAQWTGNSGGAEYAGDVRLQLVSTGQFLTFMTREEIDSFRDGQNAVHHDRPYCFALWEEADQDLQGICYPGARVAEAVNLFASMSYDDLRSFVGAGTDDLDDVEVQFSRVAAQALTLKTAAELVGRMVEADLQKRRLNPAIAKKWDTEANIMIYQDEARRASLEGAGRIMRWVG